MSKTKLTLRICTDFSECSIDGGIRPTAHGKGRKRRHLKFNSAPRYVVAAPLKEWAVASFRDSFPDEPDLEALEVDVQWYRYR